MPDLPGSDDPDPTTASSSDWVRFRVRRHLHWARTQGLGRLIEEDQLNPLDRIPNAIRKAWWRRWHDASPKAVPVFVVGLQRSGTNMLVRGFERSPEFEVHNENDRAAFHRFRLRPDPVIRSIVQRSRHRFVLFKPLCDSHRVGQLLDGLGTPAPGRAMWAFRNVDDRVRSSVAKFGDSNRRALRLIAEGRGSTLWQAQGLSEDSLELIRSFDDGRLSAESASALFWYVRNAIVFELGLAERPDLAVVSYDRMVADPRSTMGELCAFLGVPYHDRLVAHVSSRGGRGRAPLDLDPAIRRRCEELLDRLEEAAARRPAQPSG
jgi:hypothetical protein